MKQMIRDTKLHTFISSLKFVIVLGGMGTFILAYNWKELMGLLGLAPIENEINKNEVIGISLVAVVMLLLTLFLLITDALIPKRVKAFVSQLDAGEKEQIVWDYQNAWKGSRTIRIGRLYTFILDDGRIFRNKDMIWIFPWREQLRYKTNYCLEIHFLNQDKTETIGGSKQNTHQIKEYYEKNFPHIVVGYSDEISNLYKKDRNQFLQIRYYKNKEM